MKVFRFFKSTICTDSNQNNNAEVKIDPTDILSDEIMLVILKKLNFQDILRANAVSRSWNRLSNDVRILSPFFKALEGVGDQDNQVEINSDGKNIKRVLLISKLEKRKRVLEAELNDLRNVNNRPYHEVRRPNYHCVGPLTSLVDFVSVVEPINREISAVFKDIAKNKGIRKKQNQLMFLEGKIEEHQNSGIRQPK